MTLNDSHGHVDWVLRILKLLVGIRKIKTNKQTNKKGKQHGLSRLFTIKCGKIYMHLFFIGETVLNILSLWKTLNNSSPKG